MFSPEMIRGPVSAADSKAAGRLPIDMGLRKKAVKKAVARRIKKQ